MSLKTIELQVALPRTLEVTRIQEQQQQRTMHEQQSMINQRRELDEHLRQRPHDVDPTQKNQIREREQRKGKGGFEQSASSSEEEKEAGSGDSTSSASTISMRDPMRGRFIDISL
ncbi:hypothetical protein BRE01_39140 [Brevibacillus reuszeri]|uniref:Uncharacterized protein n=1 Tax=Brevibacillus reuszeri TaxID=54915 RepID=A0A0K9YVS7_9BACL|nr:hypothetical protein [Brevibacillus reuszeri]KNB72752.1 hypothetical protein ADS79_12985 [Brevibacillus reuszeri]MED1860543.1 hypothetical protein [Brevibacillus reuszeri]GED70212.1 hypothetical protein BRE01_39140 [Brevibacillus reuszeri]